MEKLLMLVKSRKFWAALVALVLIIVRAFDPEFPLDEELLTKVVWIVVAYIVGTGIEDAGRGVLIEEAVLQNEPPEDEVDHAGML